MNIEEFALRVGVSTATVSRAIHGKGRVSPATRERILTQMRSLNFTPNSHAQRLAMGRGFTVSLVFLATPDALVHPYYAALGLGVQTVLSEHGYAMMVDVDGDATLDRVRTRAIDGAIWVGGSDKSARVISEVVKAGGHHLALCDEPPPEIADLSILNVCLETGAREAARRLAELGHRRIVMLLSRGQDAVARSFSEELNRQGVPFTPSDLLPAGRDIKDGATAIAAALDRGLRPTAVFTRLDVLALGVLRELGRRGLRIPDDVSVIGHDDTMAEWADPPLTTVRVDAERLGQRAATLLLKRMTERSPLARESIPTYLVERETLGIAPR